MCVGTAVVNNTVCNKNNKWNKKKKQNFNPYELYKWRIKRTSVSFEPNTNELLEFRTFQKCSIFKKKCFN